MAPLFLGGYGALFPETVQYFFSKYLKIIQGKLSPVFVCEGSEMTSTKFLFLASRSAHACLFLRKWLSF